MKTLKLFNGNTGRQRHGYIAAYTQAEACRLGTLSATELRNYWHKCWGSLALDVLGPPTEPCFWVYDEEKRLFERQDKREPVVPAGGRRGLGQVYTKFEDIPKFTKAGEWECNFPLQRLWPMIYEWQGEGLNLDPEFQRAHVWTEAQQIAWLEYFLRGGRTGRVIYLNSPAWNRQATTGYKEFVLLDGKQRLEAIRRFIGDEIRVFGSVYSDFTDSLGLDYTMKVNINDLQTEREVLQFYVDFNSGGTPHSADEINRVRALME